MNIIITGASGMVGKGVLLECLDHPDIRQVLSISRRSLQLEHEKLSELIHADFTDFSGVSDQLKGYDACYHCMGVSSADMKEADYTKLTYDVSLSLAKTVLAQNPDCTFMYVSGQGTDSSEKGKSMWARVKGKTENDLLKLGFKQAFMYRPGGIIPKRGVQPSSKLYRVLIIVLGWLLPLIKLIAPGSIVGSDQIGQSMINVTRNGYEKKVLDPADIIATSKQDS